MVQKGHPPAGTRYQVYPQFRHRLGIGLGVTAAHSHHGGGILLLATGFRMIKVKEFPVAEMIPAMVLVMPISYFGMAYVAPLLG